jgi:hypothetical protein
MANATPSRIGQNNLTGATDALFLDIFGGEVLAAFEAAVKFKDKIRSRTITEGRSARFPAVYRAVGDYHVPGAEIPGQAIPHTEVTLTVDDLLIAPAFVALIDELKNHYDVRGPYAQELGYALALIYDRVCSMSIIKAARGAELFPGDGGGSKIIQTDIAAGANFSTSGSDLWNAFGRSVQLLDQKDVPVDMMQVHGAVLPAQWYLMAQNALNYNRDFQGSGTVKENTLHGVFGVDVIKSNALLFGQNVTVYNASTNTTGIVGKTPVDAKNTLPAAFPAKYQADLSGATATVAMAWVEPAAAMLELLGVTMETQWDIRRQGTLMVAKMAAGGGPLRSKCAVEITKT